MESESQKQKQNSNLASGWFIDVTKQTIVDGALGNILTFGILDANIWTYYLKFHRIGHIKSGLQSRKADRLPGQRDLILALPRWRCPWNPSDLLSFAVTRLAWVSYENHKR